MMLYDILFIELIKFVSVGYSECISIIILILMVGIPNHIYTYFVK